MRCSMCPRDDDIGSLNCLHEVALYEHILLAKVDWAPHWERRDGSSDVMMLHRCDSCRTRSYRRSYYGSSVKVD